MFNAIAHAAMVTMRTSVQRVRWAMWAVLPLVGASACFSSSANTVPTDVQVGFGSILIRVVTMGEMLDPDGYTVAIDEDRSDTVRVNGMVEFDPLRAGSYEVFLTDLAENCRVATPNPVLATVFKDDVSEILFSVTCTATP